jgi:hypothetical protein
VRSLLVALTIAAVTTVGWTSASAANAAKPPVLDILVVAGQSNALGYQSYVIDPTTHKDVFTESHSPADTKALIMWTESGVPSSGATPVPLDTLQDLQGAPSPVFGPEVGLARDLWADGHHNLLIVKVAFSGSSLADDWQPDAADFGALVSRVQEAEAWAGSHGWTPTVAAFYWMQGETDAMSASMASSYGTNLKGFLKNVRQQLALSDEVPFVIGEIDLSDFITYEQQRHECTTPTCSAERRWNSEVMTAQRKAAAKLVYVTSTARFPRFDKFIHLSDSGELSLGRAFATLSDHHLAG